MAKKTNNPADIDNKYEVIAFFISFLERHWWKLAILILLAGLAITGFTLKCGDIELHKDQIKYKSPTIKNE